MREQFTRKQLKLSHVQQCHCWPIDQRSAMSLSYQIMSYQISVKTQGFNSWNKITQRDMFKLNILYAYRTDKIGQLISDM